MGRLTRLLALTAMAILPLAVALAQKPVAEQDAKYLHPSKEAIVNSSLCQQAREHAADKDPLAGIPSGIVLRRQIDPMTFVSNLEELMEISDEVILAGIAGQDADAIAPSGHNAIHSFKVPVLHVWKGSLKVGQTIVFAVPYAILTCGANSSGPYFATMIGDERWSFSPGPYVLFLRHSQGAERLLTPDLRLAAGDGTQGLFKIDYAVVHSSIPGLPMPAIWPAWFFENTPPGFYDQPDIKTKRTQLSMAERFKLISPCAGYWDNLPEKCLTYLTRGNDWIDIQHKTDPLSKNYEHMESGKFFQELNSIAYRMGYPTLTLSPQ